MREKILGGLVVAALGFAGSASAHHSGAMYDAQTKTSLQGTVETFLWANPHAWVTLDTIDPATRKQSRWVFEGLGTNQLIRAGWKRDSIKPGDSAVIVFNPLRDGSPGGRLVSVAVDGKPIGVRAGE